MKYITFAHIHMKKKMYAAQGAEYGLGFFGALFYFLSTATSFWIGVLGILKALFWPAVLVYEILMYIGS